MTNTMMKFEELKFEGMVSEKLARWAFGLMERHGLNTNELNGMNYRQVKEIAETLNAKPFPPSPKQKETINNLVLELRKWEPKFNIPKEIASQLTGGKDGSAGEMIQFLYKKLNAYSGMGAPTEVQLDQITSWYPCIDIPFEEYGIELRKPFPTPSNPNGWMMISPDEFRAQVNEKFTKDQASEFIGKYKQTYYEWKVTRVSDYQVNTIRQLEERLATISSVGVSGYAQDEEGNVIQVFHKRAELVDNRAYQPLDEYIIRQMESSTASKYITQLESELYKKRKSSISDSQSQQNLENKMAILNTAKKEADGKVSQFKLTVDLIFSLEAIGGYHMDELHEAVQEVYVKRTMAKTVLCTLLIETISYLIDEKFTTVKALATVCDGVELAERTLEALYPEEYSQAIGGRINKEETKFVEQAPVAPPVDMNQWMETVK